MSVLVIGLGNPILRDDGVGIAVVRRLAQAAPMEDAVLDEDAYGGLRLMERMVGYRQVIVVDALCADHPPGTVVQMSLDDMPTAHSASSHDMTLPVALALGRKAGAILPDDDDIRLIGVQAQDLVSFGETCTPAVAAAIPEAARRVRALVRELNASSARLRPVSPHTLEHP